MAKLIEFNEETRRDLEWSTNTLIDTVKAILGSEGRNVVLEEKWGAPIIINNDVPIAKGIELDDPYGKIGAELVKEVAKKTDDVIGDGVTTATIAAQVIVCEGLRSVTAGANPMALKKGIEATVTAIAGELSGLATDVKIREQIATTAPISVTDPSVGETIVEAMDKVGKEGVITTEESNTLGLELELIGDMRFDKGCISLYLVTDTRRMEATLDGPYVLTVNSKISSLRDLLPVLEKVTQLGKSLLVMAEDVEGETLAGLIINKLCGTFKSIAVKVLDFGGHRKATPGDIAILTDGWVTAEEVGLSLETVTLDLLGRVCQVIVTRDECTIIDGSGAQAQIEGRVAQIRREIGNPGSDYDRKKLRERLAKLAGGAVAIRVGTATEAELKECKRRIENAVCNAEAAAEEGTAPDGGVALLQTSKTAEVEGLGDDEMAGVNIMFAATQAPLCQITMNAGLEGGVTAEKVVDLPKGHDFDAATGEYVDMMTAGIIDPVKVTRSTLQNTASTAVLFLTIEAIITDKSEKALVAADASGMDEMGDVGGF